MEGKPLRWALVALGLVWAFAIYVAYYWVHKPFTAGNLVALLNVALDIAVWVGFLAVAFALGRRCLKSDAWLFRNAEHLEELVFSLGLGLGLLSLIIFILGLAGGFKRWLFWVLFLIALILAWRSELREWLRSGAWHFGRAWHLESRLEKFLAFYLVFSIILVFLSALAPPVAWDSQVYHLTGPKLYIERGRITGGIDIPYLGFPQLVEMLFAAGLLLKGPVVARLIHFSYGILCLLALFALSRRYFTQKIGWLSAAIFYAVPSVVLISSWAYVDVALIFYELAAFYTFSRWIDSEADSSARLLGWLFLSGLFCGMGVGVKYTGFILAFSLGLAVLWNVRKEGIGAIGRALASFGGGALLFGLPWLLRNLFFTGNPFYPFFFGGAFWDEFRAWFYGRAGTGLAYTAPWRLLIAPLEMTILGIEGKEGYEATVGPLLLAVLPLLALFWRSLPESEKGLLRPLLFLCLVHYLFWLAGVGISALLVQTRLLFPIFGLLALLAGYTVERLSLLNRPAFSVQWVVKAILVLTLSLTLLSSGLGFAGDNPLKLLAGWETKEAYLHRHLGAYYEAITYINKNLPAEAKVLFLWEPRSFYCQQECQPDAILDGFLHLVYRFKNADEIAQYLKKEGFTHVLFHKRGYEHILKARFDPITPEVEEALSTLQREYLKPIYSDEQGAYILYLVRTEWIARNGFQE